MTNRFNDREVAVSVVVPCRNESAHIRKCLQSLLAQDSILGDYEIVVADGFSDDNTWEILQELSGQNEKLRIVRNHKRITPAGMNAGIAAAKGRWIAVVGAHAHYPSNYLMTCLQVAEEVGADNVGGGVRCQGSTLFQKAVCTAHHMSIISGGARWHNLDYEGPADTVFGGFYRKEVFSRLGGFDEELVRNQDDEFNLRLVRSGGSIWLSSRIQSVYMPRGTSRSLFRQYFQYGYWKVRVIQKHRIPASPRHIVPGVFVLSLVISAGASLIVPVFGFILAFLVLLYLIAVGSACTWRLLHCRQEGLWIRLPWVCGVMHMGYGVGFLRGILDFIFLRRKGSSNQGRLSR
jgi:glycosyltransferase involved in cell wall biosynthesis